MAGADLLKKKTPLGRQKLIQHIIIIRLLEDDLVWAAKTS